MDRWRIVRGRWGWLAKPSDLFSGERPRAEAGLSILKEFLNRRFRNKSDASAMRPHQWIAGALSVVGGDGSPSRPTCFPGSARVQRSATHRHLSQITQRTPCVPTGRCRATCSGLDALGGKGGKGNCPAAPPQEPTGRFRNRRHEKDRRSLPPSWHVPPQSRAKFLNFPLPAGCSGALTGRH